MTWTEECAEWNLIRDELLDKANGEIVTAHQVTTEQRKRMLAEGRRPADVDVILSGKAKP